MSSEITVGLLRDLEHIALGVLVMGIAMHAAWRFGVRPVSVTLEQTDDTFSRFSKREVLWGKVREDMMRPADLAMVAILLAFYYLRFLPAGSEHNDPAPGGVPSLPLILAQFLVTLFTIVFALSMIYLNGQRNLSEVFGLQRVSLKKWILWVLAIGVPATAAVVGLHHAVTTYWLVPKFGDMNSQQAVEALRLVKDPLNRVLLIIYACLLAPLAEEVIFRGYIYAAVKRYTGPLFSMVVVGLLFSVVHLNIPATIPLWVFAIILALAYELSGSLWVPIGIHALFNTLNVVLMYSVPDVVG